MKKLAITLSVLLSISGITYAQQNQSVPTTIVDAGVVLTQQNIDSIEKDKAYRNNQIASANQILTNANNALNDDNANESQLQQSLIALASQNPPIQSAVISCNTNPSIYCPGWINWDALAVEMNKGINWPSALSNVGLTDSSVQQASGINWYSLNIDTSKINWQDWPKQESQGINWSQWIYNGGN